MGGLDWNRVRPMIERYMADLDCDIRIYEPSSAIVERLKAERVKLTPARAVLLDVLYDLVDFGEFASVFAAEKIVYFLQRLGGQDTFRIQFERGYYGPYSKGKIAHVLYYLNGSYLKGMVGMQSKPFDNIWILPEGRIDVEEYLSLDENKTFRQLAEKCKSFLRGFYSNYALELLATVDFLLIEDTSLHGWRSKDRDEVISNINSDLAKWSERKNRKFVGSRFMPKVLSHLEVLH